MLNCIDAHYSVELYGLANSILASISTAMPRCNAIWLKSRLEQGRVTYKRSSAWTRNFPTGFCEFGKSEKMVGKPLISSIALWADYFGAGPGTVIKKM